MQLFALLEFARQCGHHHSGYLSQSAERLWLRLAVAVEPVRSAAIQLRGGAIMQRSFIALFSAALVSAILATPSLAQQKSITWWEHSNPPHNNYSQELVGEWNKKHPDNAVQYQIFLR